MKPKQRQVPHFWLSSQYLLIRLNNHHHPGKCLRLLVCRLSSRVGIFAGRVHSTSPASSLPHSGEADAPGEVIYLSFDNESKSRGARSSWWWKGNYYLDVQSLGYPYWRGSLAVSDTMLQWVSGPSHALFFSVSLGSPCGTCIVDGCIYLYAGIQNE